MINLTSLLRFSLACLLVSLSFTTFASTGKRADLQQETASQETRKMADWVADSGDNQGMPFVILDKKEAKVFVFHADGKLKGAAPVLLGITIGDDNFPEAGKKPLSEVQPHKASAPVAVV